MSALQTRNLRVALGGREVLAEAARRAGLDVMVGNMCGTSLAMAPALLVAQGARWVDLDGPLLQTADRSPSMRYDGGRVWPADAALWG